MPQNVDSSADNRGSVFGFRFQGNAQRVTCVIDGIKFAERTADN